MVSKGGVVKVKTIFNSLRGKLKVMSKCYEFEPLMIGLQTESR